MHLHHVRRRRGKLLKSPPALRPHQPRARGPVVCILAPGLLASGRGVAAHRGFHVHFPGVVNAPLVRSVICLSVVKGPFKSCACFKNRVYLSYYSVVRVLYIHFLGANSVSDTGYANTSGLRLVFLLMTRFGAQEFGIRMKSPRSVFPHAGFPAGAACVLSADTVAVDSVARLCRGGPPASSFLDAWENPPGTHFSYAHYQMEKLSRDAKGHQGTEAVTASGRALPESGPCSPRL